MVGINQKIFIYVGGSGTSNTPNPEKVLGGYNGGGTGYSNFDGHIVSSGGGATHISLHDGLLNEQYNNIEKLILVSGGGGSGYIGNSLLKDKVMYCYDCEESSEESTKTISTTCSEETPTENCAKKGNGYARITLVSIDE